jgi:hypothetical protein
MGRLGLTCTAPTFPLSDICAARSAPEDDPPEMAAAADARAVATSAALAISPFSRATNAQGCCIAPRGCQVGYADHAGRLSSN